MTHVETAAVFMVQQNALILVCGWQEIAQFQLNRGSAAVYVTRSLNAGLIRHFLVIA